MPLPRDFFDLPTPELAKALLGRTLTFGPCAGIIVETEAYLFRDDPACHAGRGRTARNAAMFGPPGDVYVYLIYGMYHCLNIVAGPKGEGEAVLIRALQPTEGIPLMEARRKTQKPENLCGGPGRLTQALGITGALNGTDLFDRPGPELGIGIRRDGIDGPEIQSSCRIGLSGGKDLQLRFFISGNRFVSGKKVGHPMDD